MSNYLTTTPAQDDFHMPGEHEPHAEIWLGWPERTDTWPWGAKPAQHAFAEVANTIAEFTATTVAASARQYDNARSQLKPSVRVLEMSLNDCWFRDTGPTYVVNDKGERRAVSWQFNAWGGFVNGLYSPWHHDDRVAEKIANSYRDDIYRAPFVLEGGSIHCDGEGTVYTTKECLLHPGRNPQLHQQQIEVLLKSYLGAKKVIWLDQGLYADEDTNGHIDNLMHVVRPGEIILSWCSDENDPQYAISQAAYNLLNSCTDAKNRRLSIHKIPTPPPMTISEKTAAGFDRCAGMERGAGTRLAASYANFLISNDVVVFPLLAKQTDAEARAVLQQCFPSRQVIGVAAKAIVMGGGNIHCITQQIPAI